MAGCERAPASLPDGALPPPNRDASVSQPRDASTRRDGGPRRDAGRRDVGPRFDAGSSGRCSDGDLDPGEECDDGNIREGDGCSTACRIEEVPGGSTCSSAPLFAPGVHYFRAVESAWRWFPACGGDVDHLFISRIAVPPGQVLRAASNDGYQPLLAVFDDCPNEEGVLLSETPAKSWTSAANTASVTRELWLLNGDYDDGGELEIALATPACGDGWIDVGEACDDDNLADGDGCDSTCEKEPAAICWHGRRSNCHPAPLDCSYAMPLAPGQTPPVLPTASSAFTLESGACSGTAMLAPVAYAVEVPAGQELEARLIGSGPTEMLFATDCRAVEASCVRAGLVSSLAYANTASTSTTVILMYNFSWNQLFATFELTLRAPSPPPPPPDTGGFSCSDPARIEPGRLRQNARGLSSNHGCCRPDRTYVVEVPPGHIVTAVATSTFAGSAEAYLDLQPVDVGTVCPLDPATCSDAYPLASWLNTSSVAQDAYVVVAPDTDEDFVLDVRVAPRDPPPPGDACASAIPIGPGSYQVDTRDATSAIHEFACPAPRYRASTPGPDRIFEVSVPFGMTLTASAPTLLPGYAPQLFVTRECHDEAGIALVEGTARVSLTSYETETTYYLVVDDDSGSAGDVFLMEVEIAP